MRQYTLDEIRRPDIPRIAAYLNDHARPSGLAGIWWIDLQPEQLSEIQQSHADCQPFCFAVELGQDFVKFEFLIRSQRTMRCPCIGYATPPQREFILDYADRLVAALDLRT